MVGFTFVTHYDFTNLSQAFISGGPFSSIKLCSSSRNPLSTFDLTPPKSFLPRTHLAPGPCRTLSSSSGPIIRTPQRYHTISTLRRRCISPEFSSVRFSTVRARRGPLHVCQPILTSFLRFLLGIVIVLFFQCISALFSPTHRRGEAVKWGLVFYTLLMFSVVTIYTATYLNIQSISLIDNREFPGVEGLLPPGPLGYRWLIHSKALTGIIPNLMFLMGNWLADCLMVSTLFDAAPTRPDV